MSATTSNDTTLFIAEFCMNDYTCRKCRAVIGSGEVRLIREKRDSTGKSKSRHSFHPGCLFATFEKARVDSPLITKESEINGFDKLKEHDQKKIRTLIATTQRRIETSRSTKAPIAEPENDEIEEESEEEEEEEIEENSQDQSQQQQDKSTPKKQVKSKTESPADHSKKSDKSVKKQPEQPSQSQHQSKVEHEDDDTRTTIIMRNEDSLTIPLITSDSENTTTTTTTTVTTTSLTIGGLGEKKKSDSRSGSKQKTLHYSKPEMQDEEANIEAPSSYHLHNHIENDDSLLKEDFNETKLNSTTNEEDDNQNQKEENVEQGEKGVTRVVTYSHTQTVIYKPDGSCVVREEEDNRASIKASKSALENDDSGVVDNENDNKHQQSQSQSQPQSASSSQAEFSATQAPPSTDRHHHKIQENDDKENSSQKNDDDGEGDQENDENDRHVDMEQFGSSSVKRTISTLSFKAPEEPAKQHRKDTLKSMPNTGFFSQKNKSTGDENGESSPQKTQHQETSHKKGEKRGRAKAE